MSPTKDMVWSKEKVDNFLNDLRKIHKGFNMNVTQ